MKINAENQDFETLNGQIRSAAEKEIEIENCLGHRYIGCGVSNKKITVNGISGNALGAYLNGGELILNGNAQDAVGDTMNAGKIVIHGNVGDTVGYAMRGGEIYVQGDAGYRAGIHMKAYKEKTPVLVIGGKVFIRSGKDIAFPPQVRSRIATEEEILEIESYIEEYCRLFGGNAEEIKKQPFTVVAPNSNNPYKQLYVRN